MNITTELIERYRRMRGLRQLRGLCAGKYAFVGVGSHSTSCLYPVLAHLHVPLKYICCRTPGKLPLVERAYPGVCATTSLRQVLGDDEVRGVFVSASPHSHFALASQVLGAGKSLFIEKPPCASLAELQMLQDLEARCHAPVVAVDLQKRMAPAVQVLRRALHGQRALTYSLRYLTGAYPEGNPLLDLFIHPLDLVCHLFGRAEVRAVERGGGTLFVLLRHSHATGCLELSTAHSWSHARESLEVNTPRGTYALSQMERLTFRKSQRVWMGIPLDKVLPGTTVEEELFASNPFVPTLSNNQLYVHGYYSSVRRFVELAEGHDGANEQSLGSLTDTYRVLEEVARRAGTGSH